METLFKPRIEGAITKYFHNNLKSILCQYFISVIYRFGRKIFSHANIFGSFFNV